VFDKRAPHTIPRSFLKSHRSSLTLPGAFSLQKLPRHFPESSRSLFVFEMILLVLTKIEHGQAHLDKKRETHELIKTHIHTKTLTHTHQVLAKIEHGQARLNTSQVMISKPHSER
jgi:hypothetical protein